MARTPQETQRFQRAAELAAAQLGEAEQIVKAFMPSTPDSERSVLVAAVVQAIALNMHAVATAKD